MRLVRGGIFVRKTGDKMSGALEISSVPTGPGLTVRVPTSGPLFRLGSDISPLWEVTRGGTLGTYSGASIGTGGLAPARVETASLSLVTGGTKPSIGLYAPTGGHLGLVTGGIEHWRISSGGPLLAVTDGGPDIGQVGANRPRHIYTWGDVWAGNWLHTGYGAFLGGTTPSWWKFDPQATRFLIRDDTSSLDKLALVRGALAADGDTALSLERRAGGASALVAVRWKDFSNLAPGDKVLVLAG